MVMKWQHWQVKISEIVVIFPKNIDPIFRNIYQNVGFANSLLYLTKVELKHFIKMYEFYFWNFLFLYPDMRILKQLSK